MDEQIIVVKGNPNEQGLVCITSDARPHPAHCWLRAMNHCFRFKDVPYFQQRESAAACLHMAEAILKVPRPPRRAIEWGVGHGLARYFQMICSGATFSQDGKYRYKLIRMWQPELPPIVWVMLNPSTADAHKDDATIRRCIGFSMNWGFGGIEIYNLFAYRSTDPSVLLDLPKHRGVRQEPVGPENDGYLRSIPTNREIICAWGNLAPELRQRHMQVLSMFSGMNLKCLGKTGTGYPRHPVRLAYKTEREAL